MKGIIILSVLLIGTVFGYQPLTGDIRHCATDLQDVIKLVEQVQKDYQGGDVAGLINDAALLVNVGIKVSNDCNFQGEIAEEFTECFGALQELLAASKKINKDFMRKNPYEAMQKFGQALESFSAVKEECPKSKEEIIERIGAKKNLEFAPNVSEIEGIIENMDFESFRPIACSHDVYTFGRAAIRFLKEYRNDTLEQKVEGFFGLLEKVGPLLDDCGIQVPSWLNNTVVVEACAESVINGFELIKHTVEDYENKNSTLVIIGDIIALGHQIVMIRDQCSGLVEEEELVVEAELQSLAAPGWTPQYPFNITECLQATTDFSAMFGNLWTALNTGQSTGNVITAISKIVVDIEPLLRTCGANQTAAFLAKEVPEACLVSVSDIAKTAADIFEHRENTVYVLTALATLYQNLVKLRGNCPFLQGVMPELPDYDFENHQRIEKEVKNEILTFTLTQEAAAPGSEKHTKLFKFNVTTCVKSGESLSAEIDNFKGLFFVQESKRDAKALTESVIKIKELLHVFLPACGLDQKEKILEALIPTVCVDSAQQFLNLSFEAVYGDQILPEIIEMLPEIYLSLVQVQDTCPQVAELFEQINRKD